MDSEKPQYWFEAKSYGFGWTLPVTWQGWVTVLVYVALLVAGLNVIVTPLPKFIYIAVVSLLLIGVVVWKGEKPARWRWGR